MQANCFVYDWLNFTLPVDGLWYDEFGEDISDGHVIISLLGMSSVSFQLLNGVRGYSGKLWFDGINIHLPSDKQPNLWLEMSGSGCRCFESYGHGDWQKIFDFALKYCHITRLDVSFDDHSGILDIKQLFLDTYFERAYVSRANKHECELSWDDRTGDDGSTIYHGSRSSNTMVRIYDKAKQLHRVDEHWVRVEMELHQENATDFLRMPGNIGDKWCGILHNFLRYVDSDPSDSNRWRWPLKIYWAELLRGASALKWPEKPGAVYNMDSLDRYVFGQAGNSIRTFIEICGVDVFLERLKETSPSFVPEKHRRLIAEFKRDNNGM